MNSEPTLLVTVTRRYEASPERVFDAWLDPAKAALFLFKTNTGEMLRCDIDPKIGGGFTIVEKRPEGEAEHFGEYVEIDRPRRLVFMFSVDKDDESRDRIEIDIQPKGNGCELTLTHTMKTEYAEYRARTEKGWAMILDGLAKIA